MRNEHRTNHRKIGGLRNAFESSGGWRCPLRVFLAAAVFWSAAPLVAADQRTPGGKGPSVPSYASAQHQAASGKGTVFTNRDKNLHCVEYGAGHVWCGFSTSPSALLKVDPDSLASERIVFAQGRGLHDLAFDGHRIWAAHASGHLSQLDPKTHAIRTTALPGRPFAYTSFFERDVWIGLYSEPGKVLRVDRETGQCQAFVMDAVPNWSVRALAGDGTRIWAALYTVPAMVAVIDPQTKTHQVLVLGERDELKLCTAMTFDGRSIWVGLDTMPATLVQIDPATLEYKVHPLHPLSSCCRGLTFADGAVWAGLYMEPAEIVRFDPQAESYEVVTLPDAYFNTRGLVSDGTNLWIGLQNIRYGPSALYRLPMAESYSGRVLTNEPAAARPARRYEAVRPDDGRIAITPQDWYRVRRGEDQIAWQDTQVRPGLPGVVLSRRAAHELAFLNPAERQAVLAQLGTIFKQPNGPTSKPIHNGGPRRLSPVGELRIVFQPHDGKVFVSTIRKRIGVSFDPENMAAPPKW